jgi:hypothetical protein
VTTAIREHPHDPVVAAYHDDGLPAHCPQAVISGVRDLAFVAYVEPAPVEDILDLELEYLLARVHVRMNASVLDKTEQAQIAH